MTTFDIVLLPFPFADLNSSKKRPGLVLASFRPRAMGEHLIIGMMTSQIEKPHFPHDVVLSKFQEAGLPKPTLVRLSKIVTLDSKLVIKKLGNLQKVDRLKIQSEFKDLFSQIL